MRYSLDLNSTYPGISQCKSSNYARMSYKNMKYITFSFCLFVHACVRACVHRYLNPNGFISCVKWEP